MRHERTEQTNLLGIYWRRYNCKGETDYVDLNISEVRCALWLKRSPAIDWMSGLPADEGKRSFSLLCRLAIQHSKNYLRLDRRPSC
jgi:hypothetical protein